MYWLIILIVVHLIMSQHSSAEGGLSSSKVLQMRQEANDLFAKKEYQKAETIYRKLAEQNPYDGELWKNIGTCRRNLGHYRAAVEAQKKAISLGSGFGAVLHYSIAKSYGLLGERDSMLVWLENSLEARLEIRPSISSHKWLMPYIEDADFRRIAGLIPSGDLTRNEGWQFDLKILAEEAKRLHVGSDRPAFSDTFDRFQNQLHARIPLLTNEQIAVEFQKLVALLQDGHSWILPVSTPMVSFHRLPVDLYEFQDGVYIVKGIGGAQKYVGYQVTQVGDQDINRLLNEVSAYVSRDNPMGLKLIGPGMLTIPTFLRAVGAADESNVVKMTVIDREGNTKRITLETSDFRMPASLDSSPISANPPPLYLEKPKDVHYWMKGFPEFKTVYFQYNQVQDMQAQTIEAFSRELTAQLLEGGTKFLICDVRRNNGGNNFLNWPLVKSLILFESAHPDNRIFVVTGRWTFSAAQNFINWVEQTTDAIFVGEPSGSKPNFVGENTQVKLPYSGLLVSISSKYHQDSRPGDNRIWIAPQIPIELSAEDYFNNHDPVMEAVFRIIAAESN